ncbi:MAG: ribosome small subunit-dependent GTPase A [Phycisphaerae bacterium]|nr:ribosome small subunit-dependent GTPase A [Gemmatimonadaceae bacterium]
MKTIRARVSAVHRDVLHLHNSESEIVATLSNSLFRSGQNSHDPFARPTVGDWIIAESPDSAHYRVIAVEPRTSTLVRRSPGSDHAPQLLAANVDTAFIFSPFPEGPNVRRLARLVSLALAGNIIPVVVLSRIDTVPPEVVSEATHAIASYLPDVSVVATSTTSDGGLFAINPWLWLGATIVLLGPSGAGKSTMLNALAGASLMETGATRRDGAGRHTTTHRAMIELPSGLFVIDTPGLREVGVWASAEANDMLFHDIAALAADCRFADCNHDQEPGCAVRAALRDGVVASARWEQWQELRREAAFLERSQSERRRRERQGSLAMRRVLKNRP